MVPAKRLLLLRELKALVALLAVFARLFKAKTRMLLRALLHFEMFLGGLQKQFRPTRAKHLAVLLAWVRVRWLALVSVRLLVVVRARFPVQLPAVSTRLVQQVLANSTRALCKKALTPKLLA